MSHDAFDWEKTAADGAWDRLDGLEGAASTQLSKQLATFEAPYALPTTRFFRCK